ncbi:MAG: peptidoglycan-binding protein [Symploca sp. SIO1A3]|nr:peptidoglycan-binding protein [Symploca sp. SIO1A3]
MRTLGNPYFTLDSPWELLNQISLDGLKVIVSLKNRQSFSQRLSAEYVLSSPINLGFISITGLTFRRDTTGKVTLAIEGSSPLADSDPAFENLMTPEKGQDVQDLPSVPGRGEQWFKLFLLVLGQRIGITGTPEFKNTKEAICALQNVPSTTGDLNPVNPNANRGSTNGLPYYNPENNWLIAAHLGLMKVGDIWSIDVMVIFNDPNLYGLRLALAGSKVGGLANLVIDIIYKKITDDIGVYQLEFTFPDAIRNLNFGAVSITLPQIGIKVYTNGDFFIDIGFPYNLDFRRSFSIAAIVFGVPVLGAGGLYFGKLSNATSTQVPKTNLGTFDPVFEFGIGLQLGLGYNFEKGPLKAGFALTVFGIIEGVVAAWHPYNSTETDLMRESSGALQSDYYFKLSGTVGIIGLLYGSVNFAIISASVNVKITLSIQMTYESYREIPIVATATVDISLKVKIDLGLFSISINLSFSTRVSASFIIGTNSTAPWELNSTASIERLAAAPAISHGPDAAVRRARAISPKPKRLHQAILRETTVQASDRVAAAVEKPTLSLLATSQFTVIAPEESTDPGANQGALVFLMLMDAPDPTGENNTDNSSFEQLTTVFFPWIIDTLANPDGTVVDLAAMMTQSVTREQLETWVTRLADTENKVLSIEQLLQFLDDAFILNIENPIAAQQSGLKEKLDKGAVIFPPFDGLLLTVPKPDGTGSTLTVDFESYATANPTYAREITNIFEEVAARIDAENQESVLSVNSFAEESESMAALVFVDVFSMIARQLLQAAEDALKGYAFPLEANSSIDSILNHINAIPGNSLGIGDIATPNAEHPLAAALAISVEGLRYTIQASETLNAIAQRYSDPNSPPRWTTMPEQLILTNQRQRILRGGVTLTLETDNGTVEYQTQVGDTFFNIAAEVHITIEKLATESVLYNKDGLLLPTVQMNIPPLNYTTEGTAGTASSDTLTSIAGLFNTTVIDVATANSNVQGLFSTEAVEGLLVLANLDALYVSDLWQAISDTDQVSQTAGMVSRFMTYGLRLPFADGLIPSSEFLYPLQQTAYAVYQLTGQQFPTPTTADTYSIELTRKTESHGVSLAFIEFNGAPDETLSIDLTPTYERLNIVVDWAQQPGNFEPSPQLEVLPLTERSPQQFVTSSFALWSSSAMAAMQVLTNRTSIAATEDNAAQPQPTLWALPPALTNLVNFRQTNIEAAVGSIQATLPLLPQFAPQVGRTNPASGQTDFSNLGNWAWCTQVDFQIKRLPAGTLIADQGTGAGDSPPGPAIAPTLPNTYELIGPTSADALQLERLLTAMNELGEDIVSGLFLLYDQNGPGAPLLVTPGTEEFLAFITQTNLSTETNPTRSLNLALATANAAPRGIANSPGEFIQLMWELSVVRSGGYFLFYESVESGEGLPASIFDPSGTGNLSMVVVFSASGSSSFGNTVPNFINSFVTTDAIDTSSDIVQAISQSATGLSAPLGGEESLQDISAIYGPGPGRIAEANPNRFLTDGVEVPISGVVHQLVEADLVFSSTGEINASETLNRLAAYFSAGVTSPISGQEIANFNPGVEVELAAVFYIPDVTYVVNGSNPPGNSFNSMASYYGISLDEVARSAFAVNGIFPANDTVTINSQLFQLRPQLPPRNLGIELQRVNLGEPPALPPNPTPDEKAAYARASMFQLYTSLSAGLATNAFFKESPMGMPFGPQHFKDTSEPAVFESASRSLENRRSRLARLAEKDFDYRQSLGIGDKFALVNAAPEPSDPALPPKCESPYIGVGSTAQVSLRWQDLFGNITVTPFTAPPRDYKGALNGAAAEVLYSDRLTGLGEWPNVKASYIYADANDPKLELNFKLDSTAYQGDRGQAQANNDLKLYKHIYFQLHQDYSTNTTSSPPGIEGNAVSMSLCNSLFATPKIPLGDRAETIRKFIRDCVIFLANIVGGQSPEPVSAQLVLPVDISTLVAGNIIELDVDLLLERNPLLTEPSVAALENGLSVSAPILPEADSDAGVAYTRFASAFEAVLQTNNWFMKVGEGLKKVGEDENGGDQQLWAVRFGKVAGEGIYFNIGEKPSYYAPKPVAKALESDRVTITNYQTGEAETVDFDGVDLNLWFQTTLDAIDTFLSADYSPHAFILDKLEGVHDPLKDGNLGVVLSTKESLANSISTTVESVLSTSETDASTKFAAAEKLRQQLLNQIGAAYRAGATIVFGLSDVSGGPPSPPAGPPNLYGQPGGTINGQPINQNYSLTPTRIPLGEVGDGDRFEPRLAFVFSSKNLIEQAYVPLDLNLQISHLEFQRRTVPGIQGYVDSRWLAFVNGQFSYPLGNSTANIPVVNRYLPTPPTVSSQTATRSNPTPVEPNQLTAWNYQFEYLYQQSASDAVSYIIELNRPPETGSENLDLAEEPNLFTALAQFISSYPDILKDFNKYLLKIEAQEPDAATIDAAQKAVTAFANQTRAVAEAYARSLAINLAAPSVNESQLVVIKFQSSLDSTIKDQLQVARTNIFGLTIDDQPATWDEDSNTITNGSIVLPAVVISIEPNEYTPKPVPKTDLPQDVELAYLYELQQPGQTEPQYLSFADAQSIASRTVGMDNLDVLAYQNAWASIFVQRNLILFPIADRENISTNNEFLFQTPVVRFADPIVPRLVYPQFSLDGMQGASDNLEELLSTFFADLYQGGNGTTEVSVAMEGAYSYSLVPSVQDIPRVNLPINLLTPDLSVVNPRVQPDFVSPFAATIEEWRETHQPTLDGSPQIDIELKVFGETATKQPLIYVQSVEHTIRQGQRI